MEKTKAKAQNKKIIDLVEILVDSRGVTHNYVKVEVLPKTYRFLSKTVTCRISIPHEVLKTQFMAQYSWQDKLLFYCLNNEEDVKDCLDSARKILQDKIDSSAKLLQHNKDMLTKFEESLN